MAENAAVSRQIAVYKTNKCLLETINCLKPAPGETPWHIHAEGKEEGYSLIRFNALDYSKGTGDHAVSVYANLIPEDVKYLFMKLCMGYEEVLFEQQKIFNDPSRGGVVTILRIDRAETNTDGEARRLPWTVDIRNGTGKVAYNKNGGQYCQAKSFREERHVRVLLDDAAFFRLLSRTCAVIDAFEQRHLYRDLEARNFRVLYRMLKEELDKRFGYPGSGYGAA